MDAPPVDPAMPFLSRALNVEEVNAAFARQDEVRHLTATSVRLIQHKPGRRAVIEYHVEGRGRGTPAALIGKVRAKGLDKRALKRVTKLHQEFSASAPDHISVPPPAGVLPEFNMWLQEKVGGISATNAVLGPDALSLAPRLAQAAHKVHRSAVLPSRTHTGADELKILEARLRAVAEMRPDWATRLTALMESCRALVESLRPVILCPIHRDFHPGQILVDGDRLWLLDFDLFSWGDPAVDIGNFIAHITELSLRHFGDERHLAGVEQELENAYVTLAGEGIRPRIAIYAALTLARHVFISTQFPDRRAFTERILELARERVAQAKLCE